MKVIIPKNLKGPALTEFLLENKSALIAQKKAMPVKFCDAVSYVPDLIVDKNGKIIKASNSVKADVEDSGVIRVKVVANTSLWCDSQMDVLLLDSAKKSIRERKGLIPHLHDHIYSIEAELGIVKGIYYQDIPLSELGLTKPGNAQCLIFESDIYKSDNERIYNKYKAGRIKQHSIGLQYVKLELAINDEESEKEFDFWNKYINQVINPEVPMERGFFWVVPEYKLLENSAVLFGSNILTPTLSVGEESNKSKPPASTHSDPLETPDQFDFYKALEETQFFNR